MPPVSEAATAHAARVLEEQARLIAQGRRAWRFVDSAHIGESWDAAARSLLPVVTAAQERVALSGSLYAADTLAEQGAWVAPEAITNPRAFAGVAPDGRDLAGLLHSPAATAKTLIGGGMGPAPALSSARGALDRILSSVLSDTARSATSVDIATRKGTGYVRQLVGQSCPNCVILAGRFYRWNAGFLRHPHDDCVHVPCSQAASSGLVADPHEHFNAMSAAEQDAFWGPGDAQAIRDGADIYRVGNARRGAKGLTTLEGTARDRRGPRTYGHGFAQDLRGRRLTPDGIYAQATSREEALALLERHGYIVPGGQIPGGSIIGADYQGFGQMGRGGTRRGASDAVRRAQATGVRDLRDPATMTAAERRVFDSTMRYEQVVHGRNPFTRDGAGLTPQIAAKVEKDFRRQVVRRGERFTDPLDAIPRSL